MNQLEWICLVDDQADYSFILQKLFNLSFAQYPIRLFQNGQALLDELPRTNPLPALILMDLHMPVLNGYQTLCQLKQNFTYQLIPVVMISGEADASEVEACYRAGANSFLRKPVDFQLQLEMIAKLGQYWLQTNLRSI